MYKNSQEGEFLGAIGDSFCAYTKYGPRSNRKLRPIHRWLADKIIQGLGRDYSAKWLEAGGEYRLKGKYYPKDCGYSNFQQTSPDSNFELQIRDL